MLIEVIEPPKAPASAGAVDAFGEPDAKLPRNSGPHPSYEQFAYLSRGFTLFEWYEMPPAALWLYRPTDLETYLSGLGAGHLPHPAAPLAGRSGRWTTPTAGSNDSSAPASPVPKPPRAAQPGRRATRLQRTAGNRAVTEAITTVQRHRLNPENIEESPPG